MQRGPGPLADDGWGAAIAAATGADRNDEAARSPLAWYDIGAVLALNRLPTGRPAVRKVPASRVAHTPTAGKKLAIREGE